MSSSTLFKIAGSIFLLMPIGHTKMAFELINPGLASLGNAPAAYASKVSWNQANGYFITSGLLCLNWATKGVGAGLERYVFGALIATHSITGLAYARKKVVPVALVYWMASLLMGIAAAKGP